MEKKELRTIRIFGRDVNIDEKTKFVRWSYTNDGKKFYQVKFMQECEKCPKKSGYYLIKVKPENVSLQKGKKRENFQQDDTLWIKQCEDFVKDEAYQAKREAEQREAVDLALTSFDIEEDENPFKN